MLRESGVLLHITSLPGDYGIGKFGKSAVDFACLLKAAGFSWWQLLPFGPPGAGFSPYQCFSAFAGNPMLINPDDLYSLNLLTEEELEECKFKGSPHSCDFIWIEKKTEWMLEKAFCKVEDELLQKVQSFVARQQNWLPDYALYMTLRKYFNNNPWWKWEDEELKGHNREALAVFAKDNQNEINYHCFVQYIIDRQWQDTRAQIHEQGIKLIGDLPIYVSMDSCDVWANSHYFELDEKLRPARVAGVPPDYFSEDGQLWGNPLYEWSVHQREDFRWWKQRIGQSLQWFDRLRLDHFRGFESYWAVPSNSKTAKEGEWLPGPGENFFVALFAEFGKNVFIAEDLGEIDDAVRIFLQNIELPGMRVLQFGFDPYSNSTHLPCYYPENSIAFTGTHDNNTVLGWLWDISDEERNFALRYVGLDPETTDWGVGGPQSSVVRAFLRTLWSTTSQLAIAPVQDLLGYGSDTRMNTPGLAEGQWKYRVTNEDISKLDPIWLQQLNNTFRRYNK